ncbi:hypothetical protein M2150_002523 [Lachnospiraceae bacterium PM6-15]|uniref:Uncharacterized protein n=1 Tax=Ohessyouella blattaphilus TaxID=2949333 RepID=A0ABT1EJB7_9FIRM|nr:hypothetical protein [Ohessyouella blattaphilus]MCP1110805.1 hypothetical protein [Ohessyouella blattaphilus]MCR8564199.1 hypothetical protein [Ohessyouella blattaphilus]
MLKVRVQGTKEEILWLREQIIAHNKKVEISEVSDFYKNKGTKKFVRHYFEVNKAKCY